MIRVTGRLICANAADAKIVMAMLPEHVRLSRAEPGCIAFSVEPTDNPLVWELDESFTDHAAYKAHQARTRASEWDRATAHLKRDFQVRA